MLIFCKSFRCPWGTGEPGEGDGGPLYCCSQSLTDELVVPALAALQLARLVILLGVGHAEAGMGRVGADPAQILVDACVDSRRIGPGAAFAPGDNAGQLILAGLLVEEHVQRTAAVAGAGILGGVAGAEHVVGDQSRSVATFTAFPVAEHEHLHLLGERGEWGLEWNICKSN